MCELIHFGYNPPLKYELLTDTVQSILRDGEFYILGWLIQTAFSQRHSMPAA